MALGTTLSLLAARPLLDSLVRGTGADGVGSGIGLVQVVSRQFMDHGDQLTRALQVAQERTWRVLELALAGETFWSRFDSREHQAARAAVRTLLDEALPDSVWPERLKRLALADLRHARKEGILAPPADGLGEQFEALARLDSPAHRLASFQNLADVLAGELRGAGWDYLARLATTRLASGEPLLSALSGYFLRRAVEQDPVLFRGLAFARLEQVATTQTAAFEGIENLLLQQGLQLDAVLEETMAAREGMSRVEATVVQAAGNVLDLRAEIERQGDHIRKLGEILLGSSSKASDGSVVSSLAAAEKPVEQQNKQRDPEPVSEAELVEDDVKETEHSSLPLELATNPPVSSRPRRPEPRASRPVVVVKKVAKRGLAGWALVLSVVSVTVLFLSCAGMIYIMRKTPPDVRRGPDSITRAQPRGFPFSQPFVIGGNGGEAMPATHMPVVPQVPQPTSPGATEPVAEPSKTATIWVHDIPHDAAWTEATGRLRKAIPKAMDLEFGGGGPVRLVRVKPVTDLSALSELVRKADIGLISESDSTSRSMTVKAGQGPLSAMVDPSKTVTVRVDDLPNTTAAVEYLKARLPTLVDPPAPISGQVKGKTWTATLKPVSDSREMARRLRDIGDLNENGLPWVLKLAPANSPMVPAVSVLRGELLVGAMRANVLAQLRSDKPEVGWRALRLHAPDPPGPAREEIAAEIDKALGSLVVSKNRDDAAERELVLLLAVQWHGSKTAGLLAEKLASSKDSLGSHKPFLTALGQMGDRAGVPAILEGCAGFFTKGEAHAALIEVARQAPDAVVMGLTYSQPAVRVAACDALAAFGTLRQIPPLRALTQDKDKAVADAAWSAWREIALRGK